tara:strand:- start:59 stop:556 length:498 start_codon:yes stop_codon:yes gene_type:complete
MPIINPNNNKPYEINNPDHIFYALKKDTGYEIRAFDQQTMPIPTKDAVKVIPQALRTPLTDTNMRGIAITIRHSKDPRSLYRMITLIPDTHLTADLKTIRRDQLFWAAALAAPIGLAILCLRLTRTSSDQTLSLRSTLNQSIFSKAAFDTLAKTMALLPEAVQPH